MSSNKPRKQPVELQRSEAGYRRFQWTEDLLELLGVLPDTVVAKKAGVHPDTVAAERRRRDITPAAPARSPIEWTEEMISLLGSDSDYEVGAGLGLSRANVRYKRSQLGIPPFNPPPHHQYQEFPWEPEDIALLGKVSDGELARTLAVSPQVVRRKRRQLGIPPFQPAPQPIEWTPEMIERLGKAPDSQVAEELGIAHQTVARKRWELGIPGTMENRPVEASERLAGLLHLPDTEVRRLTGLDTNTVKRLRRGLAIRELPLDALPGRPPDADPPSPRKGAGSDETPPPASPWRTHYRWRPEEVALLGTAPDHEIAKRLRRTMDAVQQKRTELGIPTFSRSPFRRWTAEEGALLGAAPDEEIAARIGRSLEAVRTRRRRLGIRALPYGRWDPGELELLGTASDAEVASRLRRTVSSVGHMRRKLGIARFSGTIGDKSGSPPPGRAHNDPS